MGLAVEDHVQTLLGSPAPLLVAFSENFFIVSSHHFTHCASSSCLAQNQRSTKDLATSLAATLLGGGLALYFT